MYRDPLTGPIHMNSPSTQDSQEHVARCMAHNQVQITPKLG